MAKRIHVPVAKTGQLIAKWGRPDSGENPDVVYAWGAGGACKADSRCLMDALEQAPIVDGKSLRAVLEERGYDIRTLKFSINVKETQGE